MSLFDFPKPPPLSLYVHIPWCARKCPYCDFNSHQAREAIPEKAYLAALLRDLQEEAENLQATPALLGVFLGGGTPSLLSPDTVAALLEGIRACLPLAQDAEITLEANPGTVDSARFEGFYQAGINRLSLGIQSFEDGALTRIGRIHDARQAMRAIEQARAAGFANLNLDLMFGLPGQNLARALEDLRLAVSFQPAHLSWYQLTLEPNTPFYRQPPVLPDDDLLWAMQQAGQAFLAEAGYAQYEISAYASTSLSTSASIITPGTGASASLSTSASVITPDTSASATPGVSARPGYRCRHNLNYWEFGDYLGIGAGAHGKLSRAGEILRSAKPRHPRAYLRGEPAEIHSSTPADARLEFMLNALRLCHGFAPGLFAERTGLSLEWVKAPLAEAQQRGWLTQEANRIRPTSEGLRLLNEMLELFMD